MLLSWAWRASEHDRVMRAHTSAPALSAPQAEAANGCTPRVALPRSDSPVPRTAGRAGPGRPGACVSLSPTDTPRGAGGGGRKREGDAERERTREAVPFPEQTLRVPHCGLSEPHSLSKPHPAQGDPKPCPGHRATPQASCPHTRLCSSGLGTCPLSLERPPRASSERQLPPLDRHTPAIGPPARRTGRAVSTR